MAPACALFRRALVGGRFRSICLALAFAPSFTHTHARALSHTLTFAHSSTHFMHIIPLPFLSLSPFPFLGLGIPAVNLIRRLVSLLGRRNRGHLIERNCAPHVSRTQLGSTTSGMQTCHRFVRATSPGSY